MPPAASLEAAPPAASAQGPEPAPEVKADVKPEPEPEPQPAPDPDYAHIRVDGDQIRFDEPIAFEIDDEDILPKSFPQLEEVVDLLGRHPEWRIRIEGHMENPGGYPRARSLSGERAASVLQFLVEHGVDRARLEHVDYGEDRPLEPPPSPRNRRVELWIVRPTP